MTTQSNQAVAQPEILQFKGMRVVYNNIDQKDNFKKHGITIQSTELGNPFDRFTTAKNDNGTAQIRCSGKPNEKNIIVPEGEVIESGDLVNVAVAVGHYNDDVYPRIVAIRLVEKAAKTASIDLDADMTDLV